MRHRWILAGVSLLFASPPLLAQRDAVPSPAAAAVQAASLRTALGQMLAPSGIAVPDQATLPRDLPAQELRLVWEPRQTVSSGRDLGGPRIVSRVRESGAFPRLRAIDLSDETLLVAAIDSAGTLLAWSVIPDPRFVRIEEPGPDGVLTGRIVPVDRPEFLVLIPDDTSVAEIRLFQRRRTGDGFVLEQVAALVVPAGGGAAHD